VNDAASVEALFVVKSELGLHARPAGRFVALAGRFDCEVLVGRGNDWVSGKSVLSLLSLAAGPGTELRIRAVGPGAEEAVDALGRLLEEPEAQGP
jgi:phosphocarrier protein